MAFTFSSKLSIGKLFYVVFFEEHSVFIPWLSLYFCDTYDDFVEIILFDLFINSNNIFISLYNNLQWSATIEIE